MRSRHGGNLESYRDVTGETPGLCKGRGGSAPGGTRGDEAACSAAIDDAVASLTRLIADGAEEVRRGRTA